LKIQPKNFQFKQKKDMPRGMSTFFFYCPSEELGVNDIFFNLDFTGVKIPSTKKFVPQMLICFG
jgi:hypothetical protein